MITLISPAKINLFLRILEKRPDGYHELASLFQAISLHDTLHFSLSDQDELTCDDPHIPTDASNLVLKATDLFRRKTGLKFSIKVHLEKCIPHQAGLGGGSSNAATTLWALNQLHGFPVSLENLIDWSAEIGSDITFFLSEGTAYCTGRGEYIRSLPPLPSQNLWVAKPHEGLSTPLVFKQLNLQELSKEDPEKLLKTHYSDKPIYVNDLEFPAMKLLPSLKVVKEQLLNAGFETVMMSGSGTALFCLGNRKLPTISHVRFYPCTFINRRSDQWFQKDLKDKGP